MSLSSSHTVKEFVRLSQYMSELVFRDLFIHYLVPSAGGFKPLATHAPNSVLWLILSNVTNKACAFDV